MNSIPFEDSQVPFFRLLSTRFVDFLIVECLEAALRVSVDHYSEESFLVLSVLVRKTAALLIANLVDI